MTTLSRRRFLLGLGAGAAGITLAGCADGRLGTTPSAASSLPSGGTIPTAPGSTPPPSASTAPSAGATAELDLRAKIAQMLLVGFRGRTLTGAADTVADIRDRGLGGILLFDYDAPTGTYRRNIESPAQLRKLVSGLRAAATISLLVAIDEEGGQVDRLKHRYGFPTTESAAALGARGDAAYTRRRAKAIGTTLAGLGIDLDLAPVVDVNVNPSNPIIGALDRSFSSDPAIVATQGRAFLDGLNDAGVAGALKHFPGHGSSTGDTHLGWVDVTDTWTRAELVPFRDIIAAGSTDAVLVAHVFDATLDPDYPASLSQSVITGMLRGELGFEGVVISDDLQMGAIRQVYGFDTAVERAILAGTDVLTIANQQLYQPDVVSRTIDVIADAVSAGRIPASRIDESWTRIRRLKGV